MTSVSIDRMDPRAPSRQMADELREEIRTGLLKPRSRLPSERELVQRYGTAPQTARQAVSMLKAEGLVVGMSGRGVFVREPPSVVRVGSGADARWFQAELEAGHRWREEILELAEKPAPELVAESFGVAYGTPVFLRRGRLWFEGEPSSLDDSYYLLDVVQDTPLAREHTGQGGPHARLAELGHRVTRFREDVSCRMPSPWEAQGLQLNRGVPVAELHRTAFSESGPVEVLLATLAGDRHIFSYDYPAPA